MCDELAQHFARRQHLLNGSKPAMIKNIVLRSNETGRDDDVANPELADHFLRPRSIINGNEESQHLYDSHFSPYREFKEFTRKEIADFRKMFETYDVGKDGFIDLFELKLMMEKLSFPQTHVGLKAMIKEVDEDFDGKISYREFLLIFRKAAVGELVFDGLKKLAELHEINVAQEGVKGAKRFFEAKANQAANSNRFMKEIKEEQEERKKLMEEKRLRRQAFKEKAKLFQ